jgi:leucyl aminopeptidase
VHLDVAAPARCETAHGYASQGATAFGARTIVAFLSAVADDAQS